MMIIFTKMIISTSWEPSSSFEMRRGLAGSRGGDTSVLGQHKDDDQDQNEDRGIKIKIWMNCSFKIKRWGDDPFQEPFFPSRLSEVPLAKSNNVQVDWT